MCGRFALDQETNDLAEAFTIATNRFPEWVPRWNIAPTTEIPIIITPPQSGVISGRVLGPARWSLTPSWSDTLELPYPTFNARVETLGSKPTFRTALSHHRALIPATAYYEWSTVEGKKQPHAVSLEGHPLMVFAGLYSVWSKAPTPVVTATIITQDAPKSISWLHPRSPVVLGQQHWDWWLNPETRGDQAMADRLVQLATDEHPSFVTTRVAPLRGDGPQLLEPLR